jgi:cytochrome P450
MNKKLLFFLVFFLVIFTLLDFLDLNTLKVNMIVFLTLRRGIISQNCFWWGVNDTFADSTGAEVYQILKKQDRFVKLNIFGKYIYLVTDIRDIARLLDLSPNPFGPGTFKHNFFDTFIPRNVGISVNPDWKYKRDYNDKVLETDRSHSMNPIFQTYIQEAFSNSNPKTFDEFTELTRRLTSKIIFGTFEYNPIIYKIFKQADSILSARFNINTVNQNDLVEFREYLYSQLQSPSHNTLLELANKYHRMLPIDDVIDQIPHWIFPIAGLFSVHLPRLLVLLANHPNELSNVVEEIKEITVFTRESYIRKCILELFRLNNAVNSTFRGLTESFTFENSPQTFEPGTQFVFFNNPVLRDVFEYPNEYKPARWNQELEESYKALMFNQGNQKCPGKELVLSLITMGLRCYLETNNYTIRTNIKLDPSFIPYILNPCTITFD